MRETETDSDSPRRETTLDALCAPIGDSGHALPPPFGCACLVAPHPPYLPAGDGERLALPGSLLAGVTFTPAPSPTALTCYLARREDIREDKSDAEGTILT